MTRICQAITVGGSLVVGAACGHAHPGDEAEHAFPHTLSAASDISDQQPVFFKTGSGDFQFQTTPEFFETPQKGPGTGATHGGVVVDHQGRIYLTTDDQQSSILVFGPDGKFLKSIAPEFVGCHSILVREEEGQEYLYVAHLAGKRVAKLTLEGTPVWTLGFPTIQKDSGQYPEGAASYKPTSVAVAPDGGIFIADGYGKSLIHQYDKDLRYVRTFGGYGTENGKFKTCHGIAIDERYDPPRLLVCDRENRRLQHHDLAGKFIETIAENLRRPCSVAFDGDLVAVAELEARVTLLNAENEQVARLGDNPDQSQWAKFPIPPEQWKPGIFTAPHGCGFDHDGNLLVTDWNRTGRITRLERLAE